MGAYITTNNLFQTWQEVIHVDVAVHVAEPVERNPVGLFNLVIIDDRGLDYIELEDEIVADW